MTPQQRTQAEFRASKLIGMLDSRARFVWAFRDAPEEFRALSDHGGDEDFVFYDHTADYDFETMVDRSGNSVSSFNLGLLGTVYITAHA